MSRKTRARPPKRAKLALRVAWLGAATVAVAGILAAAIAGLFARSLVVYHGDVTVRTAALELAEEVLEELHDDDDKPDDDLVYDVAGRPTFESILLHELEDIKLPDATALVLRPGAEPIGDRALPAIAAGTCTTRELAGLERRLCAVTFERAPARLILAVSARSDVQIWNLIALALCAGALIGAVIGGVASYGGASWALAPLTRLRDQVRQIDPEQPNVELLGPAARHAEIEELRNAVRELVERLGVSLAQAQSFSAAAAHELRTPLAVLAGELELMAEAKELDQRAIARTRHQLEALISLVQRLLVLATPGRSALEQGEAVDLADVVATACENLASEQRARIDVASEDDIVVRGDPNLLVALLNNALDNALKFSTSSVELSVRAQDDEAWLEVRDRGAGVPEAEREKVFAPFYRSAEARVGKTAGHGIGLSLIAHVARAHGGRAEFVSVTDGALLCVRLPRWRS